MALRITRLEFCNFRNYEHFLLEDIGPVTVFVGENAVGKTNIIEGISLLTSLSSFRHPRIEHLILEGFQACEIKQSMADEYRSLELKMSIEESRRRYFLNGKPKKTAQLKGTLPSVVFTPDDLDLVKGGHGVRRDEIDSFGSQLSANHYIIKKDYESVLKHKNRLLKDGADDILIENINDMVVTCGAQLCCYRSALVRKIGPYVQSIYRELSSGKENLEIRYIPSWNKDAFQPGLPGLDIEIKRDDARAMIYDALEKYSMRERESKRCLIGPHLDHLCFYLNGKDASLFGSQGQQRSIVLSFKLAELALIQDVLHQRPVLLLDDVMSELDETRRNQLISFIEKDTQVFITTTNMDYFNKNLLSIINEVKLPVGVL